MIAQAVNVLNLSLDDIREGDESPVRMLIYGRCKSPAWLIGNRIAMVQQQKGPHAQEGTCRDNPVSKHSSYHYILPFDSCIWLFHFANFKFGSLRRFDLICGSNGLIFLAWKSDLKGR
jgi:hypothetical protein